MFFRPRGNNERSELAYRQIQLLGGTIFFTAFGFSFGFGQKRAS